MLTLWFFEPKKITRRIKRWNEASKSYQNTMYTMYSVCFVSNITHSVYLCVIHLKKNTISLVCDNCSKCMENLVSKSKRQKHTMCTLEVYTLYKYIGELGTCNNVLSIIELWSTSILLTIAPFKWFFLNTTVELRRCFVFNYFDCIIWI